MLIKIIRLKDSVFRGHQNLFTVRSTKFRTQNLIYRRGGESIRSWQNPQLGNEPRRSYATVLPQQRHDLQILRLHLPTYPHLLKPKSTFFLQHHVYSIFTQRRVIASSVPGHLRHVHAEQVRSNYKNWPCSNPNIQRHSDVLILFSWQTVA